MSKTPTNPADYIAPLNMNGLNGRMMVAPSVNKRRKREIMLVYGHHAQIERWWGLVENLREYGNVTMPDLPGFGGMESFFKIGQQPTIDNFADYLAAFVRLRYKRRRITIVGISFGFVVVTRMLQRYPDLAKKVDLVVSMVGFMHRDDFHFKPRMRQFIHVLARLFGTRPVAYFIRYAALNGPVIKAIYVRLPAGKRRLSSMDPIEAREMFEYDVKLWQMNDVATHWRTNSEFIVIDNCRQKIDLPIIHVGSNQDSYFDHRIVEQHMLVVFREVQMALIDTRAHTPNLIADKAELAVLVPPKLRKALR